MSDDGDDKADETRTRICTALAVPLDEPEWLELAEHAIHAYRQLTAFSKTPPANDLTSVAGRIRCARECIGLTRPQLAARMGYSTGILKMIEEGERDLEAHKLPGLAMSLGVSRAWLLGDSQEGGPPLPREVLRMQASPAWHLYRRKMMGYSKDRATRERALRDLEMLRVAIAEEKKRGRSR